MEATFAFVDLAGFSALTETHGDEAAADLVGRFTVVVDAALAGEANRVATIGDAVFLAAATPAGALHVLSRLWEGAEAEPTFPSLRAGLHHGEAVMREGTYFGAAVNIAARVTSFARGGQVVCTAPVAEAARGEGITVASLGEFELKNVRGKIGLFSLQIGPGSDQQVIDPVCRMRVVPERAIGHLRVDETDYYFCSVSCAASFAAEHVKRG